MSTPVHTGDDADIRYAVQFSPKVYRARLSALCGLYREIREIPQECRDPAVAETKLRWWEEEIQLLLENRARHPVARAFQKHCADTHLTEKFFLDIIDSTRQDIHPPSFPAYDDVVRYCNKRGGALTTIAARLCGAESIITLTAARDLGCGWQLAGIVSRNAQDAQLGRVYFAVDDLRAHKLDKHVINGIHSDAGLKALLAAYGKRAEHLVQNAIDAVPAEERDNLVMGNVLASLGLARVHKMARRDFAETSKPVELSPFSALFTAWSAARRVTY